MKKRRAFIVVFFLIIIIICAYKAEDDAGKIDIAQSVSGNNSENEDVSANDKSSSTSNTSDGELTGDDTNSDSTIDVGSSESSSSDSSSKNVSFQDTGSSESSSPDSSSQDVSFQDTGSSESSSPDSSSQDSNTSEFDSPFEGRIHGVIIDESANVITIQSENGTMETYEYNDETTFIVDIDTLEIGDGVTIEYDRFTITSIRDYATYADKELLKTLANIIIACNYDDLDMLLDECAYPLYIGLGGGTTFDSKGSVTASYDSEDVFTKDFEENVTSVNLLELTNTSNRVIIRKEIKTPALIMEKQNDIWQITKIYY